jgi:hypothetical protein
MRDAAPEVAHIVFVNTDMLDPHKAAIYIRRRQRIRWLAVDARRTDFD